MQTQTIEQFNRRVRRDNDRFEAMTPSRKRIEIARDVLRQIRIGRLIPENGTYFDAQLPSGTERISGEAEASEAMAKLERCTACALGSVFMCAVQRFDKVKLMDLGHGHVGGHDWDDSFSVGSERMREYLKSYFSSTQVYLIETAFEGGVISYYTIKSEDPTFTRREYSLARSYNRGVKSATERLERIMRNIERHGGRFTPSDRA